jgi:hypothetical protein
MATHTQQWFSERVSMLRHTKRISPVLIFFLSLVLYLKVLVFGSVP